MTPEDIAKVQTSWASVQPHAEIAANLFYNRLFYLDPSVKTLFKGDMKQQGQKLMTMLDGAIRGLNKVDQLIPALHALGERHASYGVLPEHYDTVGQALIWTLETSLLEEFNEDTKQAWLKVYTLVADTMQQPITEPTAALI